MVVMVTTGGKNLVDICFFHISVLTIVRQAGFSSLGTRSAVQTASFMLLWLQAIAEILAAPSCTSWMFLMYLAREEEITLLDNGGIQTLTA